MSAVELSVLQQVESLVPKDHMLVIFGPDDLPELRRVLDRAMSTWEPSIQPKWLQPFSDAVDRKLRK